MGHGDKVVFLKCYWYDSNKGVKYKCHGLVDVAYKLRMSLNDPFILPWQAQHIYCTKYPSKKRKYWWAVFKIRKKHIIDKEIEYQEDEASLHIELMTSIEIDYDNILVRDGYPMEVPLTNNTTNLPCFEKKINMKIMMMIIMTTTKPLMTRMMCMISKLSNILHEE